MCYYYSIHGFVYNYYYHTAYYYYINQIYEFYHAYTFSVDQHKPYNWTRAHLIYRKNDHAEWNGPDSCRFLMSTIVEEAKKRQIE